MKRRLFVRWRKLDHLIIFTAISQWRRRHSACVMARSGHFEHILGCFHGSLCSVEAENLEFVVCLVYRQNVTCLKRFTRCGHYAGEVEDIIIDGLAVVS